MQNNHRMMNIYIHLSYYNYVTWYTLHDLAAELYTFDLVASYTAIAPTWYSDDRITSVSNLSHQIWKKLHCMGLGRT